MFLGHRSHRGCGYEAAVGHDRAVPLVPDVREIATTGSRLDRGSSLERRPGHGSIIAET